jgi:glyoxylase-like metal-dependent hydrolase (beta-lactamase superfamily II)
MAHEIGAGIYRLKLPLPWAVDLMPFSAATINVYLVQSGESLLLVDSGLNDRACYEKLRSEMAYLGFRFSQLTDLVATHFHPDHIGLLDALAEAAPQARIHLHPYDLALIRERFFQPQPALERFKGWLAGHGLPSEEVISLAAVRLNTGQFSAGQQCQPTGPDLISQLTLDGQNWQLIWTPGHTPGHLVLYQPATRLLLAGDQIFAGSSPNISKFPGSGQNPLADYLSSLSRLVELPVSQVWPGHGEAFTDLPGRVATILRQHRRKLSRLVETLGAASLTGYEIASLLWSEAKLDLDSNSRRLALTETLALLEWLDHNEYLVRETDRAGLTRYTLRNNREEVKLPWPGKKWK